LRQSAFLVVKDSVGGCSLPTDANAGGLVYQLMDARLNQSNAQRVIGITDAGDQG
jgi:hypothetical protein